jgi:ribosome-associated heat shock protein Hsp15
MTKKISTETEKIRLDKWLWAARFFKTRALAMNAIKQGKVLFNGQKPNPSREVRIGATLTVEQGEDKKTIVVKALEAKRQGPAVAQTFYEETDQSIALREKNTKIRKERRLLNQSAPRPEKRPDKNERRKMRALRRQDED